MFTVIPYIRSFATSAKHQDPTWLYARHVGRKIRQSLVHEWTLRGITQKGEFAQLTNHIAINTFDMTPACMKQAKGLPMCVSLRDHMSLHELSLIQLAELTTLELIGEINPQGFNANLVVAGYGGQVAKIARRIFEKNARGDIVKF